MATKTPDTTVALIVDAMKRADRSKKWTAERAGIANATFLRKLRGDTEFTVSEVARVARALGVRPVTLLPAEFRVEAAA